MRIITNGLIILFFIFTGFAFATSLEREIPTETQWDLETPTTTLMQVRQQKTLYAFIGNKLRPVAELYPNQGFYVSDAINNYHKIQFGNAQGYLEAGYLEDGYFEDIASISADKKIRFLSDSTKKTDYPIYGYLITTKNTPIYSDKDIASPQIATLLSNLRYPVLSRTIKEEANGSKINWFEISLGDRLGYISSRDVKPDLGIPILTYHHILKATENHKFRHTSTTTSLTAFTEQMNYLKEAGYETLSLNQVAGYLNKSINLPGRAVALTFDDGLQSVYRYAYPLLKENGQRATLFVISSRIKSKTSKWAPNSLQFMSWQSLRSSRDVFDIQSHSHFLHRLDNNKKPIIFSRQSHTIILDLQRSQRVLSLLNPHQYAFAYPFGGYNQRAINAVKASGMTLAVTTQQGKVRLGDPPFALKRLYALSTDPIEKFARMVGNDEYEVVNKNIVVDK
ncbi:MULTISPECIES: polysaccharide deacetylase family protein [Proteus]|uniref:Polysaccharide deacetylase family protein n=1 Tax=Proteus penneri TaxID=102862 RepID=A0ABS0WA38_9GAMM|nr:MULTISPECIES: polysaccharide deacetylase family protein [Proteus]MBJ2119286.1 polysaccharide deacetylase family protein [Proteus penneri]NBM92134.1 polysaccharide deacetylase family protein [Proteus sp. G2662]NBM96133.1 polysaccharide deacetylase family protein [Proteus sp. G2660]NBN03497.1 polysaccharide deacetylase family protein [Proteus sp. G2665]NBN25617.1 polysaccharide deacetylase family protein [Proteus sp. G2657]